MVSSPYNYHWLASCAALLQAQLRARKAKWAVLERTERALRATLRIRRVVHSYVCLWRVQGLLLRREEHRRQRIAHHAAANIQRVFQGHLARRRARALARLVPPRPSSRTARWHRIPSARPLECRMLLAIKIQSAWRCFWARKVRRRLQLERADALHRLAVRSALILQAMWRRGMLKRRIENRRRLLWAQGVRGAAAATKVQAVARGFIARRVLVPHRAAMAVRLTRWWRGHVTRIYTVRLARHHKLYVAACRVKLWCLLWHRRRVECVRRIQSEWRGNREHAMYCGEVARLKSRVGQCVKQCTRGGQVHGAAVSGSLDRNADAAIGCDLVERAASHNM
eukprot:PhM_4_TR2759/c1_g1_i1/m.83627